MSPELLSNSYFWYILGVGLIILDLVIGLEFFVLSFGVGALVTGLFLNIPGFQKTFLALDSWNKTLLCFGVASLALIFPIRKVIYSRYKNKKDINDY